MTVYLIVGLPGAGKTTRARQLEVDRAALRLTPDEWQMAVFHRDGPTGWRAPERADQRDRIEGLLVEVGLRAAELGLDVVLDFGLWGRDERSALRALAASVGARAEVVYLPVGFEEQRRRITGRFEAGAGQFQMDDDELRQWRRQFQEPDAEELAGGPAPPVPTGYASWWRWACERWPSLTERPRQGPGPREQNRAEAFAQGERGEESSGRRP